jgi:putative phage-type endonuclease
MSDTITQTRAELDAIYRAEWLAWRRQGIGASDVAGILNLSPWGSPYSVWADKRGFTPDDDATEAMLMGLALEPTIAMLFHQRTGLYVVGAQTRCTHPVEPWARATLDGGAAESPNSDMADALGGFEGKSTSDNPKRWEEEIPAMYMCQIQFQMAVTGMERTWLGVLHSSFGARFRTYGPIERDEADIALIMERCEQFWFDHVLADVAPPVDGHSATTDSLKAILAKPGAEVELSAEAAEAVADRDRLKADEKLLGERLTEVENRIRAAMGDATEGLVRGELALSWRSLESLRADPDALRAAGLFEQYSKLSSSRRLLRHNKPKES